MGPVVVVMIFLVVMASSLVPVLVSHSSARFP